MEQPKVLFIDRHDTISSSKYFEHLDEDLQTQIASLLFEHPSIETERWMRGGVASEEVIGWLSHELGIPVRVLWEALKQSCYDMKIDDEAVLHAFADLRSQGVRLVIATDNMDTFARWTTPKLDLGAHVDAVLNSHFIGYLKQDFHHDRPLPFFEGILRKWQIPPEETVLLDDSLQTVRHVRNGFMKSEIVRAPAYLAGVLRRFLRS